MAITFSPWGYPEQYVGLNGGFYFFGSPFAQSLPGNIYLTAMTIGSWYGPGTREYIPGWANRFFADRAPTQQGSGGYPPALEDRAKDYVRKALGKELMPDGKRYATAYDAYSTNQHAEITKAEQAGGADGREKAVWDLADSMRDWMENGDKRADYNAALGTIRRSKMSEGEKLAVRVANLVMPGSSELTEDVARAVAAHLKPAEMPSEKTPKAIMAAYIRKLGGKTVAQSLIDEASAQVASRGVPTKGRAEYVADLEKKGLKAPEASAVYDRLLASMTDSERREALGRMGEIKTNKKDTKGEKEQYDQYARVAAMRALGVKNEDELNALYGKYKAKKFAKFLDLMRKDVTSGKIPKAAAAGGGRGRRRRRRVLPQTPAPTPASPAPATGPTRRTP